MAVFAPVQRAPCGIDSRLRRSSAWVHFKLDVISSGFVTEVAEDLLSGDFSRTQTIKIAALVMKQPH